MSEPIHTDSRSQPDSTYYPGEEPDSLSTPEPVMPVAQATYLALPPADRERIDEFLDDPSTAVKRTYQRRS